MDAKDLQWDLRISSSKLVKINIHSVRFFSSVIVVDGYELQHQ